jgi:hypothetical protein
VRAGTILGLDRSRLHVRLDDIPLEIKVYTAHVEAALGARYGADDDDLQLEPTAGAGPRWRVGDPIHLRTAGHDPQRDRWILEPILP